MYTDDGIVIRVPDADEPPPAGFALLDPDEIEQLVTAELGSSALFASRFRECAARALLLPRRQPGRRSPLWQQRQRAAQLLAVASGYGSFPIVLETMRECLQDVFDVPALTELMRDLAGRKVTARRGRDRQPARRSRRSLLFRYVGAFMYEGDAPLAERRAQALALDSALLAELLGQADLRELLDPRSSPMPSGTCSACRRPAVLVDAEQLADLITQIGPLSADEVAAALRRARRGAGLDRRARRAAPDHRGPDSGRAALGGDRGRGPAAGRARRRAADRRPGGVHRAAARPARRPGRALRAHARAVHRGRRRRTGTASASPSSPGRCTGSRPTAGSSRASSCRAWPARSGATAGVLRMLQPPLPGPAAQGGRAGAAAGARGVPARLAGRPARRGAGAGRGPQPRDGVRPQPRRRPASRPDAVYAVVEQLAGAAVPASALESLVLPAGSPGYSPGDAGRADRGRATSSGPGAGALPGGDGWLVLAPAESAPLLLPRPARSR